MPSRRALLALLLGSSACQGPGAATTGFTSANSTVGPAGSSTSSSATTDTTTEPGTTGGAASSSTTAPWTSSGGTTSPASTGSSDGTDSLSSSGSSGSTGTDTGDGRPAGCDGKIDFLFVISSHPEVANNQADLQAALPQFITTIEEKFAGFDVHIMAVDATSRWGTELCDDDACGPDGCPPIPDYPCDMLGLLTACDETRGAGSVFPGGRKASNTPCKVAGGRRYLTMEQPDLTETFICTASVGISGHDLLGEVMTNALQPEINAPGGCNAGFLRDDALLMVTFFGGYDYQSEGDPDSWAQAVLAAKNGDPNAVVLTEMREIDQPPGVCDIDDRICEFVKLFPYHMISLYPEMGAGFSAAADLVAEACEGFIPQ